MRKILACMMAGTLFMATGCAAMTQPAAAQTADDLTVAASDVFDEDAREPRAMPEVETAARGRIARNGGNIRIGKIVSVDKNEIIVELAETQWPERDASSGDVPSRRDADNQGGRRRPEGSRPERGENSRPEGGGRGFGGQMELTYSGEQETYSIDGDVKITSGMGENGKAIDIAELAKDDVVWLGFGEDGNLTSISLLNIPESSESAQN